MNKIENITEKIISDAEKDAGEIIHEAEKKAKAIIEYRTSEAEEVVKKLRNHAKSEGELLKERMIASAAIKIRDEQLKAKQEIIDEVFSQAKEQLVHLDMENYVNFLKNALNHITLTGKEILFVPKNMKRVVEDLQLPFILSSETVSSGFLLKGEHAIYNYTFEFLLEFYREELELAVARELFS